MLFGLLLNSLLERFAKESWVIKSTMEKSLKMMLNVFEESQNEIFIIQKDGTILFTNKKAFELTMDGEVSSFNQLVEKT